MKNLVFLTLILTALVCSQVASAVEVEIPDPNLEAVIREAISKPTLTFKVSQYLMVRQET